MHAGRPESPTNKIARLEAELAQAHQTITEKDDEIVSLEKANDALAQSLEDLMKIMLQQSRVMTPSPSMTAPLSPQGPTSSRVESAEDPQAITPPS